KLLKEVYEFYSEESRVKPSISTSSPISSNKQRLPSYVIYLTSFKCFGSIEIFVVSVLIFTLFGNKLSASNACCSSSKIVWKVCFTLSVSTFSTPLADIYVLRHYNQAEVSLSLHLPYFLQ